MAEQAAESRERRTPLRTDDAINDGYGQAIAAKVLQGKAPFQRSTSMPTPETPADSDVQLHRRPGPWRGRAKGSPARAYGPAKAQFLRAYAQQNGIENPQFVSRQKATHLLRAAGETGHIKPAAKGARSIMLPRNRSATNMPVVLEKDGPNFNASREQVKGKKGDASGRQGWQGRHRGRPVRSGRRRSAAQRRHDRQGVGGVSSGAASPTWCSRSRESNARAEPIAKPTPEEGREAVAGMLKAASDKWGVTFVDDKKGKGFSRETVKSPDGEFSERSVVALPPFDVAKAGKRRRGLEVPRTSTSRVSPFEVGHACAHVQSERDPIARPDPRTAQKAGDNSRQTASFAREDMVANMAAMEFVTGVGRKFTPAPQEETSHMREAQAHALSEPGGYSKVTYNASRSLRMLQGQEPTARDNARAIKQERFVDRAMSMDAIDRAAQGLPGLGAPLTADAGRGVGADRPTKPTSTPAKEPSRDRTAPTPG